MCWSWLTLGRRLCPCSNWFFSRNLQSWTPRHRLPNMSFRLICSFNYRQFLAGQQLPSSVREERDVSTMPTVPAYRVQCPPRVPRRAPLAWWRPRAWEVTGGEKLCLKLLCSDVLGAWNTAEKHGGNERLATPLLVNLCLFHGGFEEEAAVHTALPHFSEFYKTAGGLVPVWTSWKCLRADRIMSIFFVV